MSLLKFCLILIYCSVKVFYLLPLWPTGPSCGRTGLTHTKGYYLDLVLSHSIDSPNITCIDPFFSEQCLNVSYWVTYYCNFSAAKFMHTGLPFSSSVLLNTWNNSCSTILDQIVPLENKKFTIQIWCKLACRWHYNGCKCVFAFNLHILKNTFINIIFMYFLNRARFSDIGPAHFCCTFPLSHHTLININAFFLVTLIFWCNNTNVMKLYWCGVIPEASHIVK